MILSDEHQFAFIHIPKCGGTSVRVQLGAIDSYAGRFQMGEIETELGTVNLGHVPLHALEALYPREFDKVVRYASLALVRDPHQRFLSSVMHRLVARQGVPMALVTGEMVRREAEAAIEVLDRDRSVLPAGYSHYTPQSWYVELRGRRLVKTIVPLDRRDLLQRCVQQATGLILDMAVRENLSAVPANSLMRGAVRLMRPVYRALLPSRAKNRLHSMMRQRGLFRHVGELYAGSSLGNDDIRRFIDSYYARDFEIHAAALRSAAQAEVPT
ncbi:MAG: hypothetical protein GC201_06940 [Alphaproteobacteria bacterium]|nr:hypothetical protein [Alphaproteobacteria bacterium]